MTGFLVEYHRPTGDWSVRSYIGDDGYREALVECFRLEKLRKDGDFEVAALNSDSLETLRRTHSRYFSGKEREPEFSAAA